MAHDVWKEDVAPNIYWLLYTNLAATHRGQRYGTLMFKINLIQDVLRRIRLLHGWFDWKCQSHFEFHSICHLCCYECPRNDLHRHMGQTKHVALGIRRYGNFQFHSRGRSPLEGYLTSGSACYSRPPCRIRKRQFGYPLDYRRRFL